MKNKTLIFLLFLSLFFIFLSCDLVLIDSQKSNTDSNNNLESASNYNYGYGTFGDPPVTLKKSNGDVIIEGLDFVYDQTLINIYDPNNSTTFNTGKYFKVINDSINVMNTSGLNLGPIAKDLSTNISSPESDKIYIDPISAKFVLPRPDIWSRCENINDITTNPEIGNGLGVIEYKTDTSNALYSFNTGKFNNCLRMTSSTSFDDAVFIDWNPHGLSPQISESGTLSFWFKKGTNHDLIHNHLCIGAFVIGLFSIDNEISIKFNTTWQTPYSYTDWDNFAHIYIIWDKNKSLQSNSKTVVVYLNGQEIVSSMTDLTDFTTFEFIKFSGDDHWNNKQVGIYIDNYKMWNHVVSEDPSWIYNTESPTDGSEYDDAIHKIYGSSNHFKPKNVKVGYF